jgi:hypothetical protein
MRAAVGGGRDVEAWGAAGRMDVMTDACGAAVGASTVTAVGADVEVKVVVEATGLVLVAMAVGAVPSNVAVLAAVGLPRRGLPEGRDEGR